MVFTTYGFSKIAKESWPEWDLNPGPINSVQRLSPTELSGHEFSSHSQPTLYIYSDFIVCSVSLLISPGCLVSSHVYFNRSFLQIIPWVIHHRPILWSSYRKLTWAGFEPRTTKLRSDALTGWAIRQWVQLALRANFVQLLQFHRSFSVAFPFGCLLSSIATFI